MFFDNCVWLGNYTLFCELVYFCRGWQRSNVREPFCARYYSRGSLSMRSGHRAPGTLALRSYQTSDRTDVSTVTSAVSLFFCVLGHKERGVPTTANNFAYTISWCSLTTQQVYTVKSFI